MNEGARRTKLAGGPHEITSRIPDHQACGDISNSNWARIKNRAHVDSKAAVAADQSALAAARQALEASKAALERDHALYGYSRMLAPFDGVVTRWCMLAASACVRS